MSANLEPELEEAEDEGVRAGGREGGEDQAVEAKQEEMEVET